MNNIGLEGRQNRIFNVFFYFFRLSVCAYSAYVNGAAAWLQGQQLFQFFILTVSNPQRHRMFGYRFRFEK